MSIIGNIGKGASKAASKFSETFQEASPAKKVAMVGAGVGGAAGLAVFHLAILPVALCAGAGAATPTVVKKGINKLRQ